MQLLIFYIFGFIAVFAAVSVVLARKPVMSALYLILNMLALAAIYVQLNAHLIAALQVIVYAGAIVVLALFVIMLLNLREKQGIVSYHRTAVQAIGIIIVAFVMTSLASAVNSGGLPAAGPESAEFGTVVGVAKVLFTNYLLPFEIASVLLLAAIVGAVILSKSKV
ncbi:MAG: NADH-quinone oxidoreductase subunit J [Nitrospinota bacterium]|nr:NADH-quinone oxidoreductase subunit J [Nitrospinota bacterium]